MAPAASGTATVVDFVDVPANQAGQQIVADGDEDMPDDIGLIAKFQQAVAAEKARQQGEPLATDASTASVDQTDLTPTEKEAQNLELQAKLQSELAAYRETLASVENPSQTPKPAEFLRQLDEQQQKAVASATLPPPTTPIAAPEAPNPANLPTLPEPTTEAKPQVRTLADFDVDMFAAEEERVRIPRGIKPRFSLTDFPMLEVLSFVPGRGVIAYHQGTEGVLLIGEAVEGWELVNVAPDSAEFSNGRQSHYISAE